MAVVQVRIVRVAVPERIVAMPMRMRFDHRSIVMMLVMHVVNVGMLVLDRCVRMFMVMALGEMQVQPNRHQRAGHQQLPGQRLT